MKGTEQREVEISAEEYVDVIENAINERLKEVEDLMMKGQRYVNVRFIYLLIAQNYVAGLRLCAYVIVLSSKGLVQTSQLCPLKALCLRQSYLLLRLHAYVTVISF